MGEGVEEACCFVNLPSLEKSLGPVQFQLAVRWDFAGEMGGAGERLLVIATLFGLHHALVVGAQGFDLFQLVAGSLGFL